MITIGWIVSALVMLYVVALVLSRQHRARQCEREGHIWDSDKFGFHCRRCPVRRNDGDWL